MRRLKKWWSPVAWGATTMAIVLAGGVLDRHRGGIWPFLYIIALLGWGFIAANLVYMGFRMRRRELIHQRFKSSLCLECGAACKAASPAGVSPAAGD